jgi:hypothetical protein
MDADRFAMPEESIYRIIRFRENRPSRTTQQGLTLSEAQAHCKREDTHGTDKRGRWFDGYDLMQGFAGRRA